MEAPVPNLRRTEDEELIIELHSQADWKMLQSEYSNKELIFFEIEYIGYRKQFKDLTKTEIKQLHNLIKLEIKMHRHDEDVMKANKDLDRMERLLKQLTDENSGTDTQMIMELNTQIQACRTSGGKKKSKENNELLAKHSAILKDLKSTRDQRIKNIEDRGKFIVLLKELEMESRKNSIAEIVGLMDLSVENEKKRLSKFHKFPDGNVDRPLLTPESIEQSEEVLFEGLV